MLSPLPKSGCFFTHRFQSDFLNFLDCFGKSLHSGILTYSWRVVTLGPRPGRAAKGVEVATHQSFEDSWMKREICFVRSWEKGEDGVVPEKD